MYTVWSCINLASNYKWGRQKLSKRENYEKEAAMEELSLGKKITNVT